MNISFENPSVKLGLYGGLLLILYTAILYFLGVEYFVSFQFITLLVVVGVAVVFATLAVSQQKKLNDGYIPFANALGATFLALVIVGVVSYLFNLLLFTVIDPDMTHKILDITVQKTEERLSNAGIDDTRKQEILDNIRRRGSNTVLNTVISMGVWFIISFVISLIIAAIVKKEPDTQ